MFDLDPIYLFFAFLFGACFGSFANVVIYRWPNEESVLGRSFCGRCASPIRWKDNIPILGYFLLKGRCSTCGVSYSWRYPLVEFLTALSFVLIVGLYGLQWTTLEYLILTLGLIAGSFIDLDHMILPDEITIGGTIVALVGAYLNPERSFIDALYGVLVGGGTLWLVAYVYYIFTGREGLGGGDIKLLAFIGGVLGWKAIPFVILVSSLLGAIVGIFLARKESAGLQTAIPFGPFISVAALLYMAGLKSVGIWYLQLFFPDL